MRRGVRDTARAGLTLVELVVASGLLTLLMVAVFGLLESFLSMWEKSEERRQLAEGAQSVVDLVARDFEALDSGARGDLLAEWVFFDTDADGVVDAKWPRIRLVRHASDGELARMQGEAAGAEAGEGLTEVCWAVLPARPLEAATETRRDELAEGYLFRGERVYGSADPANPSFFDDGFVSGRGLPRPSSVEEISGGVLWLGMQFATQTSWLRDDWTTGREPGDVAASWDAWSRGRPNAERHLWNEQVPAVPATHGRPALPRRVRLELELERPRDLRRRTRLARLVGVRDGRLDVLDAERLPPPGGYVLVDTEWMRVRSVLAGGVQVERGVRGTTPREHEAGALVHWGTTLVREVPIALHREDWKL